MDELISGGSSSADLIVDGRTGGTPVSFQLYQDIYNQITGRTEQLTKSYKNSIKLEFSDIEQLDMKVKQILEQWKIIASNSSYTIYFNKNQKETFSSVERFKSYNSSSNSCSENISIKYSFSVAVPVTNRIQNYTVDIQLNSRIVMQQRLLSEIPFSAPPGLINLMGSKTAEIRIDFVDYVMARTISTAFDEWVESLPESEKNPCIAFLKKKSHYIPVAMKLVTLITVLCIFFSKMPNYFEGGLAPLVAANFVFFSGVILFFGYKIAARIGRYIEYSLDSTTEMSYLKLTKGDEKNIESSMRKNNKQFRNAAIGLFSTFALNLLARYISTKF